MLTIFLAILAILPALSTAQTTAAARPASTVGDFSGMYTFLRDGEFVQIDVDGEKISGFISRYGDLESDRDAFLDQMIKQGSLDGNKLVFTTGTVHGVWFDFKGTVQRGEGKTPGSEAYYVIKGTLTQSSTDANKKTSAKSREVVFKSFPQDVQLDRPKKD